MLSVVVGEMITGKAQGGFLIIMDGWQQGSYQTESAVRGGSRQECRLSAVVPVGFFLCRGGGCNAEGVVEKMSARIEQHHGEYFCFGCFSREGEEICVD